MNPTSPSRIPATLIPGDGIGPEVVEATVQVLDALGSPFDWDVQQAGMAGVASAGDPARRHVGQHPRAPAGAEGR